MQFPTTRWDDLAKASLHGNTEARGALDELCRRYWQPVYGFIRWKGFNEVDAADLTQDFFLNFLETRSWLRADRLRGSFRTFLLGALAHRLQKSHAHQTRLKRGGGVVPESLDEMEENADESGSVLPIAPADALHFDRAWAVRVLDRSLERTREEYKDRGKAALYETLKIFLTPRKTPPSYEEVAAALAVSEGLVKTEIYRLRQAFRTALRSEIARTVSAPHEVAEELRHLKEVWLNHSHEFDHSAET